MTTMVLRRVTVSLSGSGSDDFGAGFRPFSNCLATEDSGVESEPGLSV